MATSTPNLALSKPADTENYDVGVTNANMDKIDTGWKGHEDRIDTLDTTAPVDQGGSVTAAANWTLDTIKLYKVGKLVYGYFSATRTTSAVAGVATGNIANTLIFTLPAGYRPVVDATWAGGAGLSSAMYNGMIQTDGKGYVTVALPNVGFAIGDVTGGSFCFMVP